MSIQKRVHKKDKERETLNQIEAEPHIQNQSNFISFALLFFFCLFKKNWTTIYVCELIKEKTTTTTNCYTITSHLIILKISSSHLIYLIIIIFKTIKFEANEKKKIFLLKIIL